MRTKRPLGVTIVACVYLLVGIVGFVYHVPDLRQPDGIWIELTEALAAVSGAFMILGHNWARWLAVAWMGFHVAISISDPLQKLAVHAVFFVAIAYFLFRPDSARYFRRPAEGT